jgi:crotonobetainyl-CoA:carnitine CoA-transferase CaiB-like acyl-CoA transferase
MDVDEGTRVQPGQVVARLVDRDRNREELLRELDAEFESRTTADWLATLAAAGVPCAPVNSVAEALADPQAVAREVVVEHDHPSLGRVRQVGSPFWIDGSRPAARPGPERGADTAALLRDICGYDEHRIAELEGAGVFGSAA